jgi:hypothetical protein
MKDLVLLVADKNTQFALNAALKRPDALGIQKQKLEFEFRVHPGRDGGVRKTGTDILAFERHRFSHALLVMDFEGSGSAENALVLESQLDSRLQVDWQDRAKAIVIEPEVDVWMWGSDHAIRDVVGWPHQDTIRSWLARLGFEFQSNQKPLRPKECLEAILKEANQPRSSALYEQIASKISLRRCTDSAFQRLRQQLIHWFPK